MTSSGVFEPVRQTPKGDALHARRCDVIPGGVNSNVRLVAFPTPLTFAKAQGSRIWDVDDNEYIDFAMGMGPHILGHNPAPVLQAIQSEASRGQLFAGQTLAEGELAELLVTQIPWIDQVRFGLSGTEMDLLAVRIARAVTGKQRIIRFDGHYHGWLDPLLVTGFDPNTSAPTLSPGQSEAMAADIIVAPWNNLDELTRIVTIHSDEIAAIVMEPIMCNTGLIEPLPGYLEGVRALCDAHDMVLIIDEVITGFRVDLQGAQAKTEVKGDLTIYAKAIASGYPLAALGGRRDLMEAVSLAGVNHSGTYNTGVMQVVAALATVRHLVETNPYESIRDLGRQLRDSINDVANRKGVDLVCEGPGAMLQLRFGASGPPTNAGSFASMSDGSRLVALNTQLQQHGVRLTSRGLIFLSAAHSSVDIDQTLEAFEVSL
jgi:glutamate-1-semialdehyde 2,1-aminomutase